MDLRNFGIDTNILTTLHDIIEFSEETSEITSEKSPRRHKAHNPSRAYVRDCKAMASTPADVKEYPNAYEFVVDMPGIRGNEIKVHLEDNNKTLLVSGERGREKEKDKEDGAKYLMVERRAGKFMRKFPLPENANPDAITAVCQDGVLTVTVEKKRAPEPKKPKTIEVKCA